MSWPNLGFCEIILITFVGVNLRLMDRLPVRSSNISSVVGHDPTADTSALESEIDRMVYRLYGLTEEEISIIEKL